jgi:hypothetical protein
MSWGLGACALVGYFRAFFPSWRFFDDVGLVPLLLVRVGPGDGALGPWQPCLGKARRRWHAVLLNPEANLLLAYGSLLAQLVSDVEELADGDDVEALVSYQLAHRLVRTQPLAAGDHYQFKIAVVAPGAEAAEEDDLLISRRYQA